MRARAQGLRSLMQRATLDVCASFMTLSGQVAAFGLSSSADSSFSSALARRWHLAALAKEEGLLCRAASLFSSPISLMRSVRLLLRVWRCDQGRQG